MPKKGTRPAPLLELRSQCIRLGWYEDVIDQDRRTIPYARFPNGTTFPLLRGTRDTTAALARSSKAVAMYLA